MRLWSLHPKYLDSKGLVALWRETLLAQKVLQGKTKGYKNHPQLNRFKEQPNPKAAIAAYLNLIWIESDSRGYHFDRSKIGREKARKKMKVTKGQVNYEFQWLKKKLQMRDPQFLKRIVKHKNIETHSLFTKVPGGIENWEKVNETNERE